MPTEPYEFSNWTVFVDGVIGLACCLAYLFQVGGRIGTDKRTRRAKHLGYQRSRHTTHSKTSLVKIEGVDDTNAAKYVVRSELMRCCN